MSSKEIDITQFKKYSDLLEYVDLHGFQLYEKYELSNLLVAYSGRTQIELEAKKVQWEIDCEMFINVLTDFLSPAYSGQHKMTGNDFFPNRRDFLTDSQDYLNERAIQSTNPILKARYYHVLWKSPKNQNNNLHAKEAIKNYKLAIEEYINIYQNDTSRKGVQIRMGRLYEILLSITNRIKSEFRLVKYLTRDILFSDYGFEFYFKHGLLEDMLKYNKIFKPKDFQETLEMFRPLLKQPFEEDWLLATAYLPTVIRISSKIEENSKYWRNELGETYFRLANNETDKKRGWIKQDFFKKAMSNFKISGNKERLFTCQSLYSKTKHTVLLGKTEIQMDSKDHQVHATTMEKINAEASSLVLEKSENIYATLQRGNILPTYSSIKKMKNPFKWEFLEFSTPITFDQNDNIFSIPKTEEERHEMLEVYGLFVSCNVIPFLNKIFMSGISSGKLTAKNLLGYLAKHSWVGKTYIKRTITGHHVKRNWLDLLSPSLHEFFLQINAMNRSKYYSPSFVMCVDSLTLKIEGLVRHFCKIHEISTSEMKNDNMQETYINGLLDRPKIREYFDDSDLLFFDYLISNQGGINLRNSVAHCFYGADEYRINHMLLLIVAILRLGKYNL